MENAGTLKDNLKDYAETKLDIVKLKAITAGGSAISGTIVGVALAILSVFILMFLGFSAAYAISDASGKPFLGFLVVAGFFILLAVLIVVLRDKMLTMPIINSMLQKFYYKDDAAQNQNA